MLHKWFEKIGRYTLQKNRVFIFLLALSVGPLFSAFFLYAKKQSFQDLEMTCSYAMKRAKKAFDRKMQRHLFLKNYENSDPYFLDKEIESLTFLNREKELLKGWLIHPAVSNKEMISRRLQFLEGEENRLCFTEEEIQISSTCKETLEKQRFPIEVDVSDLQTLLTRIENPQNNLAQEKDSQNFWSKGRPQLVICNFSMTKKSAPLQNEVLEITMDILKREFLSK